jgi:four helix bundle protein
MTTDGSNLAPGEFVCEPDGTGEYKSNRIRSFRELRVYQRSFAAALQVFEMSKGFPAEERYSLTDQIRRSSRSVCANLAEAWRKRRYPAAFVAKMHDSISEAAETQVWLQFSEAHKYINNSVFAQLDQEYEHISAMLIQMSENKDQWTIRC